MALQMRRPRARQRMAGCDPARGVERLEQAPHLAGKLLHLGGREISPNAGLALAILLMPVEIGHQVQLASEFVKEDRLALLVAGYEVADEMRHQPSARRVRVAHEGRDVVVPESRELRDVPNEVR